MTALLSAARFWTKVDRRGPDECWPWLSTFDSDGYGSFKIGHRRRQGAHRFAFELVRGSIPLGLTLDHLCRNKACVNPAHLEAVTLRENTLRGIGPTAENARKGACVAGHPFDEANTYRRVSRPGRSCRTCLLQNARRFRLRHAVHAHCR